MKYIVCVDWKAGYSSGFDYYPLKSDNILDAMEEAEQYINENVYLITVMEKQKGVKRVKCKLEPYIFSGFDYKLYAVPIKNDRNGINRKETFYTSDFVSLLKEHNGVFKKEPGTSEVKHIKWQERVYKDAYVCHEADILI